MDESPLLTPALSSPPGRRGRVGGATYVPPPPSGEGERGEVGFASGLPANDYSESTTPQGRT